jgi:hypothetical protein
MRLSKALDARRIRVLDRRDLKWIEIKPFARINLLPIIFVTGSEKSLQFSS